MNRFIISYSYGDGFTFSAEQYLPVVFSSKEEFLITLEDKVKETYSKWVDYENMINEHDEKLGQLKKLDLKKPENNKKLYEFLKKNETLQKEKNELATFELGGQEFHFRSFIDTDIFYKENGKKTDFLFIAPTVKSVDEFFEDVEKDLKNIKPPKP